MSKPQEQLQPSPSPEPSVFRDDAKKSDVHDKAIDLDQSSQGEESHEHLDPNSVAFKIPWTYKWAALACVVAFPIGQTWTEGSLGPLKNTLRNELGINNTQFGVISAADSIINSVWPIIGGILLDWFGPNEIVIMCTGVIFIGSILSAIATNINLWRLLVGGHVLMGFGTAVLDSAQQKFFYHWFGAGGLAFAFGLENAINKTISLVSGLTAIPIRDGTGWYGYSFWIPAALCGVSFLFSVGYLFFERFVVPAQFRLTSARAAALTAAPALQGKKKKLSFASLLELPWPFWMLPMTQLLQSGAAGGFSTSSADIIRARGYTEAVAGYLSSAQKTLPIVLSPVFGGFVDRYGHRFHFVALAPILWIIACAMLGFTSVHPVAALVFSSLAGVINAMPLQICIPLLVADQGKLGTAFGVWRAFNNSGSTIIDIAFGVLQDDTEDGGYHKVLKLAIGIKAVAFAIGIAYIIVDFKALGKGMTMTKNQREAREKKIVDPTKDPLTKRVNVRWVTYSGLALLTAMVIAAWVVFVKYLM